MDVDLTKMTEQQLLDYYWQLDALENRIAHELHKRAKCAHLKTCSGVLDGKFKENCLTCGKTISVS